MEVYPNSRTTELLMLSRNEITEKAHELDFEAIGLAGTVSNHKGEYLREREAEYAWTDAVGWI